MVNEMGHFIITCGSSQLDKAPLLGFSDLYNSNTSETKILENYNKILDKAIPNLKKLWKNREVLRKNPDKNPFGGEISTLLALQDNYKLANQWGKDDTFVLLTSNSVKGRLAADIISQVLIDEELWGVSTHNIIQNETGKFWFTIEELKDKASETDMDHALMKLVDLVCEHAAPPIKNPKKWKQIKENHLVMTGGYKSIIPCLTVLSLQYGFKLVYLFEHSSYLQFLQPKIEYQDGSSEYLGMFFKRKEQKKFKIGGWFEKIIEGFIEDQR